MGRAKLLLLLLVITLVSASCESTATKLHPIGEQKVETEDADLALLASVERALVKIVERATPAVVAVTARNIHPNLTSFSNWGSPNKKETSRVIPEVSGSGFIFREDGYILTTEHVISGAEEVEVTLFDGRKFKAEIVGTDHNTDIAVLKIEVGEPLPTLKLGDSDEVKVGQFAIAIGNPLNLDFSVTFGIISAKGRSGFRYVYNLFDRTVRYEDYIQTDAWVNKGNSGGPLLNSKGEVIGINSMIRTPGPLLLEGPGFAIPSNLAAMVGEKIIRYGRVIRGWLGIRMREISSRDMDKLSKLGGYKVGVQVMEVIAGSPADKGGIKPKDIIVEYEDKPIESMKRFRLRVANTAVGRKVRIKIIRENELKELSVKIDEMPKIYTGQPEPSYSPLERLGIRCSNLSGEARKRFNLERTHKGVLVTQVIPGKPAASAGVKTGMVIVGVEGENVSDLNQLIRTLRKVMDDDCEMIRLWVIEKGKRRMIPVEIR